MSHCASQMYKALCLGLGPGHSLQLKYSSLSQPLLLYLLTDLWPVSLSRLPSSATPNHYRCPWMVPRTVDPTTGLLLKASCSQGWSRTLSLTINSIRVTQIFEYILNLPNKHSVNVVHAKEENIAKIRYSKTIWFFSGIIQTTQMSTITLRNG